MSVANDLNLLESDHESEDHRSVALGSTMRSNSHLRSDLHISGLSSQNEEDNDARSHYSSRHDWRVEQDSPPQDQTGASGFAQGESAKERSQGPPVPKDPVSRTNTLLLIWSEPD